MSGAAAGPTPRPVRLRRAPSWDRAARILFGLALLSLTVWGPRTAWGLLGVVPLALGLIGGCPLRQSGSASAAARGPERAERETGRSGDAAEHAR